jgi:predicted dehydrogenase
MADRLVRLALVGGGRRGSFFLRQATMMTDRLTVVGVTSRSVESRDRAAAVVGAPSCGSVDELLAQRPDVVLVVVAPDVTDGIVRQVAGAGVRVLAETPPALGADGLRSLWTDVGETGLVQVAEQSMLMPTHEAVLNAVRRGVIGTPTSVHVSSNHGYHAVAIMRALLGVGLGPATVRASTFKAPMAHPVLFDEWQDDVTPRPTRTTIATLDFGSTMGLYDFTDLQWFSPFRHRRLIVRGETGEIDGDSLLRLGERTVVPSRFLRRYTGIDMNHEGFDLDHISLDGEIVYRNPYRGLRLSDEDIAAMRLLDLTIDWIHGDGPEPYRLAAGSHDHLLALAIGDAARAGQPVSVGDEPWATV